jgi:hypothetical protein
MNAPNAKTAAAARMQAPIVANNVLPTWAGQGAARASTTATAPAR